MQRYARNQSKRVVENKIVMETNANKTTLFLQLMRKRCFFVGSKLVGSPTLPGPLTLLAPHAARAPPHNINYQDSSRFAGPSS